MVENDRKKIENFLIIIIDKKFSFHYFYKTLNLLKKKKIQDHFHESHRNLMELLIYYTFRYDIIRTINIRLSIQ